MEVRRLGEEIGAEITGIDVKTASDEQWRQIYRTWLDPNVIVVRAFAWSVRSWRT